VPARIKALSGSPVLRPSDRQLIWNLSREEDLSTPPALPAEERGLIVSEIYEISLIILACGYSETVKSRIDFE